MDEMEERLEKMEMSIEAANEILVEKLNEFEDRIAELENKQDSDVKHIREELEELSHSLPMHTSSPVPRGASPGIEGVPILGSLFSRMQAFKIPNILDDVDPELREKIKPYVPVQRDVKEKLSAVQLGFCLYWLAKHQPESARKSTAVALRDAGIHAKVWAKGWKPEIVGDFEVYLIDKIKQHLKKQKKDSLRACLKRKAADLDK